MLICKFCGKEFEKNGIEDRQAACKPCADQLAEILKTDGVETTNFCNVKGKKSGYCYLWDELTCNCDDGGDKTELSDEEKICPCIEYGD